MQHEPKVGRNDPCPCGSGKKYKKCHGAKEGDEMIGVDCEQTKSPEIRSRLRCCQIQSRIRVISGHPQQFSMTRIDACFEQLTETDAVMG